MSRIPAPRSISRNPRNPRLSLLAAATAVSTAVGLVVAAHPGSTAPAFTPAASSVATITAPAQTVSGFGASGAWWVNDLNHFSAANQAKVASLLFTTAGLDLSQYRYNIGGGGVG